MISKTVGASGKDFTTIQAAVDYFIGLGAFTQDGEIILTGGETFTAAANTPLANFVGLNAGAFALTVRGETAARTGWPILTSTNDGAQLIAVNVDGVSFKWLYVDKLSSGNGNTGIRQLKATVDTCDFRMVSGGNETAVDNQGSAATVRNCFAYLKTGTGAKFATAFVNIKNCVGNTVRDAVSGVTNSDAGYFVKNCIFHTCTRGINDAGSASVSDFNDFFSCTNVGKTGGVDYPTMAGWRTASGQDASSIVTDPILVSATDLHLSSGSPCVAAGVAVSGLSLDIDGDTRGTPPCIGADEFVANRNANAFRRRSRP